VNKVFEAVLIGHHEISIVGFALPDSPKLLKAALSGVVVTEVSIATLARRPAAAECHKAEKTYDD